MTRDAARKNYSQALLTYNRTPNDETHAALTVAYAVLKESK